MKIPVEIHILDDVENGAWIVNFGSLVVDENRAGGLAAAMKVAEAKSERVERLTGKKAEIVVHGAESRENPRGV